MRRLIAKNVFSGLVTACRFAGMPTRLWPFLSNATNDGVVRMPSLFSITFDWPPSMMATQEFVVPRSMPITFAMFHLLECESAMCSPKSWSRTRRQSAAGPVRHRMPFGARLPGAGRPGIRPRRKMPSHRFSRSPAVSLLHRADRGFDRGVTPAQGGKGSANAVIHQSATLIGSFERDFRKRLQAVDLWHERHPPLRSDTPL